MRPGSFEFLCRALLGAPTLGEALLRAIRFLRIVLPAFRIELRVAGARAELLIDDDGSLGPARDAPARVFAYEWLLRLLHGVASWFVARGLALDAVAFPYARPAHAEDYALVYTEHSSFDAQRLSARLQANLLELPLRRDEAALVGFLDGAPGKITTLYRRDREMVFRVRDIVRATYGGRLYNRARGSHIDLLHSFDGGATWTRRRQMWWMPSRLCPAAWAR